MCQPAGAIHLFYASSIHAYGSLAFVENIAGEGGGKKPMEIGDLSAGSFATLEHEKRQLRSRSTSYPFGLC